MCITLIAPTHHTNVAISMKVNKIQFVNVLESSFLQGYRWRLVGVVIPNCFKFLVNEDTVQEYDQSKCNGSHLVVLNLIYVTTFKIQPLTSYLLSFPLTH